ncbi:hypothetical protein K492DRAFT_194214 [Lichtheimia hyalospora FSU 10163]|nr:hypothetical protein K492DRAFT_194214 [Lichtheimia hyalospora FSU 10163]
MKDEQFIKQLLLKDVPTRNVLKEETTFHHPKYNPNKLIVRATPAGSSQAPTSETSVIKQRITSAFQPESSSATSSSYGMSSSTFLAKSPASQKQTKRKSIMQSPAADDDNDDNDDDDDDQDFQTPPQAENTTSIIIEKTSKIPSINENVIVKNDRNQMRVH